VPPSQGRFPARLAQPVPAVLPQRLAEPVTHPGRPLLPCEDGLVDQPGHQFEDVVPVEPVACADGLGRVEIEAAREDRRPRPQRPLLLGT
jgi:hypothetical protein